MTESGACRIRPAQPIVGYEKHPYDIRRIERGLINLDIEPGGTPKALVERAVELKREATARRENSRTTTKSTKKCGASSMWMSIR
jgi:hypothetical protein